MFTGSQAPVLIWMDSVSPPRFANPRPVRVHQVAVELYRTSYMHVHSDLVSKVINWGEPERAPH